MTINDEQASELKASAENLYRLSKLLLTDSRKINTYITEPKGQQAIKYASEVDKYENPQSFYHFQCGAYYAEMRKGRKDYYVRTNYKANEKDFKELYGKSKKCFGRYITYEYSNDVYDICTDMFKTIVRQILETLRQIKENEFIW